MRKLREAFDCADVDGNNELEMEELEMVAVSMNPKANVSTQDIKRVWAVLNPEGKPWLPFSEYCKGMVLVKRDPELSAIIPMDVPNRFQLLSLLIDSPINADQEQLIFNKMSWLEKKGVRMLEKMRQEPQSRDKIRQTLDQACAGRLHYLTEAQRRSVRASHIACVLQAAAIAFVFTALPGLWECWLVLHYETDGVLDAYWTCPEFVGDPSEPQFANLSLPATPGDWGVRVPGQCAVGTCTSIPVCRGGDFDVTGCVDSVETFQAMGGSRSHGGNWSDGDGPCTGITVEVCDDDCTPLRATFLRDPAAVYMFWILNVAGIVVGIIFELSLLMLTAVRSAVRVSRSLDLRLTPLNADRAFVARMLVRTAFELEDPDDTVMGVESSKEAKNSEGNVFWTAFAVVWIKGKVILTGTAFKQITAANAEYDNAQWLKPFLGTTLACILWDSTMCHAILRNAEIRAIGVTTSVEAFGEIIDKYCPQYEANPSSLSQVARVQILRAIGVAIVKHGSMFPVMEILLRHAVHYLNMKSSACVTSAGVIDDEDGLIKDFDQISLDESRAVLCTHMLCYVLDGSVGRSELALWDRLCGRVEGLYQQEKAAFESLSAPQLRELIAVRCPSLAEAVARVPSHDLDGTLEMRELKKLAEFVPMPDAVAEGGGLIPRIVCQQFRGNLPVSVEMLAACFDPEKKKDLLAKIFGRPDQMVRFLLGEISTTVLGVLTAQDPTKILD